MSGKLLFNDPSSCVQEAVRGLLLARTDLRRISPALNVLVRSDIEVYREKYVTIISGGGSGHEPAHAGFIGDGMLSCAVLGNIFASPSVESVYQVWVFNIYECSF
jgi:dihydroxyacetone kinase